MQEHELNPIGTLQEIKCALAARGFSGVDAWARSRGYLGGTVRRTIHEWGTKNRPPHGGLGREILSALREELGR